MADLLGHRSPSGAGLGCKATTDPGAVKPNKRTCPCHVLTCTRTCTQPCPSMVPSEETAKVPPPPPCLGTTLRKNRPLVPRSNSRITFFTTVLGFSCFWWM